MSQLLVIAIFLALHAGDQLGPSPRPLPAWATALVAAAAPSTVLLAAGGVVRASLGKLDRTGRPGWVALIESTASAARWAIVAAHAAVIALLGWLGVVRQAVGDLVLIDEALAALPALAGVCLSFGLTHGLDRRLHDASVIRALDEGRPVAPRPRLAETVVRQTRHQILMILVPLLLIFAWSEGSARLAETLAWPGWLAGAAQLCGAALVFAVAPAVVRIVCDTRRLGEGELRERLLAVARANGVRVREVLVWRTGGRTINAAVVGVLPGLRYILMTDGLLERLPLREIEAVCAHEVAHIRRWHMVRLAAAVLAAVLLVGTPLGWLGAVLSVWIPGAAAATLGLTLLAVLLTLGWASRRYEWQADAFAAQHLSRGGDRITEEAAETMAASLGRVSLLSGVSPARFSWRHGSIAERQRRLRSVAGRPAHRLPQDRAARRVTWLTAGGLLAGLVLAGADVLLFGALERGVLPADSGATPEKAVE